MLRIHRALAVIALAGASAATADAHTAGAPPVGPLPSGPTAKVHMKKGEIVSISLPHGVHGRVWRIKGAVDARVLREVSEADRATKLVITFKAVGRGTATLRFGLTRGETRRAYAGRRYAVHVR